MPVLLAPIHQRILTQAAYHNPNRGRWAVDAAGGFGPNETPIQPSSITNCVIAVSLSFGSFTICSGTSSHALFFERAWEKMPRNAICDPRFKLEGISRIKPSRTSWAERPLTSGR